VLSVSDDVRVDTQRVFGVSEQDVTVIGNGFDEEVFLPKPVDRQELLARYGISGDCGKMVLYVGRFVEWKGLEYLIESAKSYSADPSQRVLTLFVGNGASDIIKRYRARIAELGLEESAKIVDQWVSKEEVADLLNAADVFVLPSVREPFSLIILQALACGCRVVAANCGGPKMMVKHELIQRNHAALVEPIQVTERGEVDTQDVVGYVGRLRQGIRSVLETEVCHGDRLRISRSVEGRTWSRIYQKVAGIYTNAIRRRIERCSPLSRPAALPRLARQVRIIEVHPTNRCNLSCYGCPYASLHQEGATFPFRYIGKIAEMEPEHVFVLGGGEPTMYSDEGRDIADFVRELRELLPDANISLCTNGVIFADERLQRNVDVLRVSMHGLKATHFSGEPMRSSVANNWENIWRYFRGPVRELWATFLLGRYNALDAIVIAEELWKAWDSACRNDPSLRHKRFGYKLLYIANDCRPDDPFYLANPDADLSQQWTDGINAIKASERPFGAFLDAYGAGEHGEGGFILPREISAAALPMRKAPRHDNCLLAKQHVLLGADGNVYPCRLQAAAAGYSYGHISRLSLDSLALGRARMLSQPFPACSYGCRLLYTLIGREVCSDEQTGATISLAGVEATRRSQNIQLLVFDLDGLLDCAKENRGVRDALIGLAQTYHLAVVSDKGAAAASEILESAGIDDLIEYVVTADMASMHDADLLLFQSACNNFALRPGEAVYVGGGRQAAIDAAQSIGMRHMVVRGPQDVTDDLERTLEEFERELSSVRAPQHTDQQGDSGGEKEAAGQNAELDDSPLGKVRTMIHNAATYGYMSTGKWLAHPSRVALVSEGRFADVTPLNAQFVPSSLCPSNCLTCTYGRSKDEIRQEREAGCFDESRHLMPWQDMKLYIDRLIDGGVQGITFTGGGEPLMNPHAIDGVEYACSRGLAAGFFTQGFFITDEIADRLMRAGLLFLRISFNAGRPITYKYFFGVSERMFYAVLQNIEKLAAAKERTGSKTNLAVGTIISPLNMNELMEIARLIKGITDRHPGTISNIWYRPAVRYQRGVQLTNPHTEECLEYIKRHHDLRIHYEAYRRFVYDGEQFPAEIFQETMADLRDRIKPAIERGAKGLRIFYPQARMKAMGEPEKGFTQCRACPWLTFIGPDGSVYHCVEHGLDPRAVYGNLKQASLAEIWAGPRRREVMQMIDSEGLDNMCPQMCMLTEHNRIFQAVSDALREPQNRPAVAESIRIEADRFMGEFGNRIGDSVKFM